MPPLPTRIIEQRPATPGELGIIDSVFGRALDPRPLTFRRAKFWFLQPAWIVMAPDGHVWFHPNNPAWRADFAAAPLSLRALVVHELVHVWQHQRGVNLVRERRPFAPYRYLPLVPGKPFAAYGIEQQAEIVRHAYVLREGGRVPDAPPLAAYAEIVPFGRWDRPLVA